MPELPEVETVRRGLSELIIGKVVRSVTHDTAKSFPNNPEEVASYMTGASIVSLKRRGKALIINLSTEYSLVVHLKMTGQLVYVGETRFGAGHPSDSLIGKLPDASTRVIIEFSDETRLYFNDQRKFGWMRFMPDAEVAKLPFMQRLGPEPLEQSFTVNEFRQRLLKRARSNIKATLLDQSVLAGVGNIYADESLWGARVHPRRLTGSLTEEEQQQLYEEIRAVMNLAIEKGGSSNHTYVNAEGKKGSYMDFARVFRRERQQCSRCGGIIEKIRVAGRGTHVCPICQQE